MFKQVNWISQSELENSTIEIVRMIEDFQVFKTNKGYYAIGIYHDRWDDIPSTLYENAFEEDFLRPFDINGWNDRGHLQHLIDLDLIANVEETLKLVEEINTKNEIQTRKREIEDYERMKLHVQATYPDYFENKKE